jgi:L-seryl-tRNA(Ser) seleniumtransferase
MPLEDLRARAEAMVAQLADLPAEISIVETTSQTGGGTMPKAEFPSIALQITPREMGLEKLAGRLRAGDPAVVGYLQEDRFHLNVRTVFPDQDARLTRAIREALAV